MPSNFHDQKFCCMTIQDSYVNKSMKVKSLKPFRDLVQSLACSRIARAFPSDATAPVNSSPTLALLSFLNFFNTRPISSGLFPLDFTLDFVQSCTKSVFFNPHSISCNSASLDDFSKPIIASTNLKEPLRRLCQHLQTTFLPTYPVSSNIRDAV